MPSIRRAFADVSVGQLHYAECGDAAAPAILLLHQTPRSWREYREVLPLLGERYRAIGMDTPGFGDSAPVVGSAGRSAAASAHEAAHEPVHAAAQDAAGIEAWARVAVELLDALSIAQAHVVGHHTGGVIAVEVAAAQPSRVRSLVLSSTPFIDEKAREARRGRPVVDAVEPQADGSHLTALWQGRQSFYPPGRPDLLEAFVADAMKVSSDVAAGHHAVAAYRMEERIGRVVQPVLLICADADPYASPHLAHLHQQLPQAQVVHIEAGMVPLPDQLPRAFADAVLDFLRTVP